VAVLEENPLLEGLQLRRTPDPCVLVIFGASGDLTQRKLFPALYSLAFRRLLPERFAVLGVARSEESDDEFRERMKEAVKEHARDPFKEEVWDKLAEGMAYVATDFADEGGEDEVARRLEDLDENALIEILTRPKNAIVKQYQRLFEFENVRLKFNEEALRAIARQAMARKVGARGLRMILEELMLDLMFHLPSQKKVKEFEVTREMVEKRSVTLAMMEKAG